MTETPNPEQPAPFVAPTSAPPSAPTMPDIADLVQGSKGRKDPRSKAALSRNLLIGGVVGAVVLLGAGFFVGQASASGPKSLYAAVQQAESGKLPCGTPASTTGAAGFLTRLCGSGNGSNGSGGSTTPGTPGNGFGGFGRGVSGTVTAISGGQMTVKTFAGSVTVAIPNRVTIEKTVSGSLGDVKVGSSVQVQSTTDTSGNRTATRITLVPAGSLPTGGPGSGGLGG